MNVHNADFGKFSFYCHAFEYIRSLNEKFDVRINVYFFVTPEAIDINEMIIVLLCRCEYGAVRRD